MAAGDGDPDAGGIDALTGLTDRFTFVERLDARAAGTIPADLALLRIDLVRFSRINAALGPRIADRVLKTVADRLRAAEPDALDIARVSGDGFAVLLADGNGLDRIAARIADRIRRPHMLAGTIVEVEAYIGATCTADGVVPGDDLLQAAEIALASAVAGPARQVRYTHAMKARITRGYIIERDLRAAVASDQRALLTGAPSRFFALCFQPKIDLQTGRLTGFEALLRWSLMEGTAVPPDEFIPVAEKCGLMPVIGIWVIRAACAALARLPAPLAVAVNVSPAQMARPGFLLSSIQDAIAQHDLLGCRLELELTESDCAPEFEETVRDLAHLGLALWIDDFGTGHSSLSRLCSMPFTGVKIDKSITLALTGPDRSASERLLRSIVSVAGALGMPTVIEGIEDAATETICREAGGTFGQGYFYARPFSLEDALDFATRWPDMMAGHDG